MGIETIQDEGQTLKAPKGKVLGIVDAGSQLDGLARALNEAGLGKVRAITGEEGVQLLERVNTFFFSDMEDRVLNRHIEELKAGNTIIAIETPSERREEVVEIATRHGARRLVHFGLTTITWLTQ